jgi:YfiH family protein
MIRPAGFVGTAFGTRDTGDLRFDRARRNIVAAELGIAAEWAFVNQVHGADFVLATHSGRLGDADAILAARPGLPVAVATADCVPIVVEADGAVAVVHAGWRGALAGVLPAALEALQSIGCAPQRAAIGPAIGPCCYEVGKEVATRFPGFVAQTTWGARSVDIPGYLESQLAGLEVWRSNECTFTSPRLYSWRRDRTEQRQVTVGWLPNG